MKVLHSSASSMKYMRIQCAPSYISIIAKLKNGRKISSRDIYVYEVLSQLYMISNFERDNEHTDKAIKHEDVKEKICKRENMQPGVQRLTRTLRNF